MAFESINTAETYNIFGSPMRLIGMLLGSLVFAAFGVFMILSHELLNVHPVIISILGWICIIPFGAGVILSVLRLLKIKTPIITLSPQGFRDVRLTSDIIPWAAIQNVSTFTSSGQKLLVLSVDPNAENALNHSAIGKMARRMNAQIGLNGLCSTAAGMDISHQDLSDMVEAFMREHHSVPQNNDAFEGQSMSGLPKINNAQVINTSGFKVMATKTWDGLDVPAKTNIQTVTGASRGKGFTESRTQHGGLAFSVLGLEP